MRALVGRVGLETNFAKENRNGGSTERVAMKNRDQEKEYGPKAGEGMSHDAFSRRHLGPRETDTEEMLKVLGLNSFGDLIAKAAPRSLLTQRPLDLPPALAETDLLARARELASANQIFKSYIGLGYYDCLTPTVILRNILENPAWYTAYTPYQAEISQGRMEALLNFQTMVMDLTGMAMANSSLLDESTAAAEAMTMALAVSKKKNAHTLLVAQDIFPQTLEVLETRAAPLGIRIERFDSFETFQPTAETYAVFVQYPAASGQVMPLDQLSAKAHAHQCLVIAATDLLALTLLTPPGEMGVDIVVGSSQRFGVPMGYGGPHAAFLSCRDEFKRLLPGRIIGVSKDAQGNRALRLALQTREQHIRREKATSNICTAQVLLAVMASMYAVYHGPEGLKAIATQVATRTAALASALEKMGYKILNSFGFDTLRVEVGGSDRLQKAMWAERVNIWKVDASTVQISLDETTTIGDVETLVRVFAEFRSLKSVAVEASSATRLPRALERTSAFLKESVFQQVRSETEMLRYMNGLQSKDLSLVHSMIPLGSCTMKLNATTEMIPVTWPEFGKLHPFAPGEQVLGYRQLIAELEAALCEITGFSGVSVQPNAGSQGEYAGLLVIRAYHQAQGQGHRDICLIPSSAHGTNPASSVMAGMKVIVVRCDERGNIDMEDLRAKAKEHQEKLAALMVTYPSTYGVFEETIKEICQIIHSHGGQVYMDGANMNALVGLIRPAELGADVAHLNLHKTFCIPHGGGGPGVGPIGVAAHLKAYLPSHRLFSVNVSSEATTAVSAAPYGSASILPISWAYIRMMGGQGLQRATEIAILNANYIARRLRDHFPLLFTNEAGYVAHECIIDVRQFKDSAGVTVDDVAKRLMDYGFHAPTMSWPVAGTLMIEPTESESRAELDRFVDAMISIREEIREIETGKASPEDNVLRNAPHTLRALVANEWAHAYPREKAAFPLAWVAEHKFWPSVARVDNVYGDKNLVCSCAPVSDYEA